MLEKVANDNSSMVCRVAAEMVASGEIGVGLGVPVVICGRSGSSGIPPGSGRHTSFFILYARLSILSGTDIQGQFEVARVGRGLQAQPTRAGSKPGDMGAT